MSPPYNQVRFELDPTGTNTDNLIVNEEHTLSSKTVRAISPTYGCFFAESFVCYDNVTQRRLTRGIDYQLVELQQDVTLKYGKELVNVPLIINREVNPSVRISYQVLGGHYTNDSTAISNMYETVIKDNRAVQWTNLLNKPKEFPPTLHRHLIDDLYGFEPVVAALERIYNALIMTNIPIIEGILSEIYETLYGLKCHEYNKNIPVRKVVTYDKLLAILTRFNVLSPYKFNVAESNIQEKGSLTLEVIGELTEDDTTLHWLLFKQTNSHIRFLNNTGTLTFKNGKAYIYLYVVEGNINDVQREIVMVGLKDDPGREDFIAVSCELNITKSININMDITSDVCAYRCFSSDTEIDSIDLLRSEIE